jgi:hypothetical protein
MGTQGPGAHRQVVFTLQARVQGIHLKQNDNIYLKLEVNLSEFLFNVRILQFSEHHIRALETYGMLILVGSWSHSYHSYHRYIYSYIQHLIVLTALSN